MPSAITIHQPVLRERSTAARLTSILDLGGTPLDMWYEVPVAHADWFSTDRADGFVVGFILQAMRLRKDIVTVAPMSSKLWHNLTQFFIPTLAKAFPELHVIRLKPA